MESIYEAEKAVVAALFRRYPDRFVWVGGSMLQLVEHSPRASFDVDLIPLEPTPPAELLAAVQESLEGYGAITGIGYTVALDENTNQQEPDFLRLRIHPTSANAGAFTLDLTRLPGLPSSTNTILLASLLGTAAVRVPTREGMLAQKWRALLLRRFVKPGDLFDVWFLLSKGVALSPHDQLALRDELHAAEVDLEERFAVFEKPGWVQALAKSGVAGLTPATARLMLEQVRQEAAKL